MFDGIACRYDFLNHFLSCGQDVMWRRYCCRQMKKFCRDPQVFGGMRDITLLDMCGGTGDFARSFRKTFGDACVQAVVGDFSFGMLRRVRPKGIDAAAVQCDAMKLPFGEASFKMMLNGFPVRDSPLPLQNCRQLSRKCVPEGCREWYLQGVLPLPDRLK